MSEVLDRAWSDDAQIMNRVKVTVEDLRRVVDVEVARRWSGRQWVNWLDGAATLSDLSFRNVVLVKMQLPGATWVDGGGSVGVGG